MSLGVSRATAETGTIHSYLLSRLGLDGSDASRGPLEAQWFSALSYFGGNQNVRVAPSGDFRKRESKYVANLLRPHVVRAVSKAYGRSMRFAVSPRSSSRDDRQAARVASRVFEGLLRHIRWDETRLRLGIWSAVTGTGIAKVSWDPTAGTPDRIYRDQDGQPVSPIELEQTPELRDRLDREGAYDESMTGDVRLEIVPPFAFYPDPRAGDGGLADCEYVAQVQYMTLGDASTHFGIPEKQLKGEDVAQRGAQRYLDALAVMSSDGTWGITDPGKRNPKDKRVRVVEYWEKPLRSNEMRGRKIVAVGDRIVEDGPNPYVSVGTSFPFVLLRWDVMPGRFWGLGIGEQMRRPQRAYNDARHGQQEFQRKHLYPVTWVGKNSGVKPVQLVNTAGLIVEYNDRVSLPPSFSPVPQAPAHVFQNAAVARSEMGEISSQAPLESSGLPGQLRSGQAVQLMQADNNAILNPTIILLMASTADIGTQLLRLAGTYYTEQRVLSIVGQAGHFEPVAFIGADLRGHYAVQVVSSQSALESPEAYQSRLLDMVQLGILDVTNAEHRRLVMRATMYETASEVYDTLAAGEEKQEREIADMLANPFLSVAVAPWEDHAAHVAALERFMNSREFDDLDERQVEQIVSHWQAHRQQLAQLAEAQLEFASRTQGGKGQASQPRISRAQ